jgi:hypothetical protein
MFRVLHCFQKKSPSGVRTARQDVVLIHERLRTAQTDYEVLSELKHYKLNRFSSERLLRFVTLLDRDVEIIIRPKAEGHASGVVSVSVA